jgi:uncharacterized protein YraI
MQRKSLALVAIAVTLLTVFLLQMTAAQAAAPQQSTPPAAADEPATLDQPIRIRIRQSIPFTVALAPADSVTATSAVTGAATLLDAAELTDTAAALDATAAITEAAAESAAETVTEPAVEPEAVSDVLSATAQLTAPVMLVSVPVTLEIELDFVVTQTLTTTVPASVTLQLPGFQTQTLPIEVIVAPLAEGEAVVELVLPEVATPVEVQATPAITATEAVTESAPLTPTAVATLAPEINGVPLIDTTTTVTANLRSGPGTTFDVVSQAGPGESIQIAAISADGQWYLLGNGAWIANFLVATQPANVPVVNDEILAAVQGTTPTEVATPTAEATPEAPAATTVVSPTVTTDANLRAGPGTEFALLGGTLTGQTINIVGRNADGTWFRLDNGGWVFAALVANPPALESVPVVNNDGSPATPAAETAPTATPAAGLGGLLPTPTPPAAGLAEYLDAANELIGQFDVVLNSVDALLAEVNSNNALITDSAWTTRMNAALTLLRRTSASVGELTPPAGAEAIQQQLETAAISYTQAADALAQAVQAGNAALLGEADALVSAATANLTAAESAITQARGQ